MSFQGDVAGIGLGELLQGLARGGKDGVLTLYGDQLAAAIGLQGGLLYLLESPEESDDQWRRRADCAWADASEPELDLVRRTAIARAERMETVFSMLEAPNLHFRFEPGPLPLPKNARMRRGAVYALDGHSENKSPWGAGMGVESVLLEHARISDEASGEGVPQRYDMPLLVDGCEPPTQLHGFLMQCDGESTIGEIADRLASPARQCQGTVAELVRMGVLRLATPSELLRHSRRELDQGRLHRAAARLQGWQAKTPAGLPTAADADQLVALWESGQMAGVLEVLGASTARQLVRLLDSIDAELTHRLDRWDDLAQIQSGDVITRFHRAALRAEALNAGCEVEGGGHELVMECLRIARGFDDAERSIRARTILRIAGTTQPTAHQVRVELGARMIEHGLRSEGAAWMLEAANALVADQDLDRATQVLGLLLKGVPEHRDAQQLLTQSRSVLLKARKRRRHGLIGLSAALAISLVAFVQFHAGQERDRRFQEVTDAIENPTRALELLDQHFAGDSADRTVALRAALEQRQRDMDVARRDAWQARFDAIADQGREGDALAAFDKLVRLPAPPTMVSGLAVRWGEKTDLLAGLHKTLQTRSESIDPTIHAADEVLLEESRLVAITGQLVDRASAIEGAAYATFAEDMGALHGALTARRDARVAAQAKEVERQEQIRLDQLLARARFLSESGRLEDAVAAYEELLGEDESGDVADLLGREIATARNQLDGFRKAHAEALAGRHEIAFETLEDAGLDTARYSLPWRVESVPSGAAVELADGAVLTTPFSLESTVGEPVGLTFTLAGAEERTLTVEAPGDLVVAMHRSPERHWRTTHRVEAAPVAVGADHIVADRGGRLARLTPGGEVRWEIQLETLGGIGRTPQFLTARPGHLLVLSEDGDAWLCNADDGSLEGPVELGAPVLEGPYPLGGNLTAVFDNNTYAVWQDQLEPSIFPVASRSQLELTRSSPYDEGNPSMVVLRSGRGLDPELVSPWTTWRAEVREDSYAVRRGGKGGSMFTVRRQGEWAFLAWEAPSVFMPGGRLWISDGEGLRAVLPEDAPKKPPVTAPAGDGE